MADGFDDKRRREVVEFREKKLKEQRDLAKAYSSCLIDPVLSPASTLRMQTDSVVTAAVRAPRACAPPPSPPTHQFAAAGRDSGWLDRELAEDDEEPRRRHRRLQTARGASSRGCKYHARCWQ